MSNVRIKFTKTGVLRFIGHLDVMRYFQKAIRRAELPIAFTTGYSPHMIMSFANPLGIGLTSEGEYFDIEVVEDISSEEAVKRLNETMANGITVSSYRYLPDGAKNCMSVIAAADYLMFPKYQDSFPEWIDQKFIDSFMDLEEIVVLKKTKKSEKEVNIRPLIYKMELIDQGLFMMVSAGSVENLKPQLVISAMEMVTGNQMPELQYHRVELYAEDSNGYISLNDIGEDH